MHKMTTVTVILRTAKRIRLNYYSTTDAVCLTEMK